MLAAAWFVVALLACQAVGLAARSDDGSSTELQQQQWNAFDRLTTVKIVPKGVANSLKDLLQYK